MRHMSNFTSSRITAVSAIPPYPNRTGRDRSPSGPDLTAELRAFSLVEVLLSLGIMSVALLIVIGILTPFMDRTGEVVETGNVNRINNRISAEIEMLDFNEVASVLNENIGLYASRTGDRLFLASDPELDTLLPEVERQYAITLTRNEELSPVSRDSTAGYLCFQIKIVRLLHSPDGTLLDSQLDRTQAVFNTAILRNES